MNEYCPNCDAVVLDSTVECPECSVRFISISEGVLMVAVPEKTGKCPECGFTVVSI